MENKKRTYFLSRGICLFVGLFSLANVVACLMGNTLNQNAWWVDLSRIAVSYGDTQLQLGFILEGLAGLAMVWWACKPEAGFLRRIVTVALVVLLALALLLNAIEYWETRASGALYWSLPVPLTFVFCVILVIIAWRILVCRDPKSGVFGAVKVLAVVLVCAVALPLMQICFFGTTDYRRDADAVVVLGARVYEDGSLSKALEERMDTAIELVEEGYAPVLVVSGGVEEGGIVDEAQAMHDYAVEKGVPESAILVDQDGDSTEASVANTVKIAQEKGFDTVIATSSFYHMPRIKMLFNLSGMDVLTVPTVGSVLENGTLLSLPREIPAWWYYWFKGSI